MAANYGSVVSTRSTGTLVLDIKPVMRQFLPQHIRQPDWVDALMQDYFSSHRP